jgi:SAM-dependent methyltransferase
MTTEFDTVAGSYAESVQSSISFARKEHAFFTRRKVESLLGMVRRHLGDPARVEALDIGAGVGETDELLAGRFGSLVACDPSFRSACLGTARNEAVPFAVADALSLPFDGESVDVVFAINVFHHVDPGERPAVAAEMARVVRPGGLVAIYEHNPYNPLTRLAVARCEFDVGVTLLPHREVRQLLARPGLQEVDRRYVIFTTGEGPRLSRLEERLGRVALGAQHCVIARRAR